MRVERNRDVERDIAYLLKALDTVYETCCEKYGENCYKCPLGSLGVLQTQTCHELGKLKSRLELVYKVVETL
jgi:hypothetical protein